MWTGRGRRQLSWAPLAESPTDAMPSREAVRRRPVCWNGSECPWCARGICLFWREEASEGCGAGGAPKKAEIDQLCASVRRLTAFVMWRSGQHIDPAVPQVAEKIPEVIQVLPAERSSERIVSQRVVVFVYVIE